MVKSLGHSPVCSHSLYGKDETEKISETTGSFKSTTKINLHDYGRRDRGLGVEEDNREKNYFKTRQVSRTCLCNVVYHSDCSL